MSTVHPAAYKGPFHGWTKTDGGEGSTIHTGRRAMMWGEGHWIFVSRLIQKQVCVARAAPDITAFKKGKKNSKAPWLGDLRINNNH